MEEEVAWHGVFYGYERFDIAVVHVVRVAYRYLNPRITLIIEHAVPKHKRAIHLLHL